MLHLTHGMTPPEVLLRGIETAKRLHTVKVGQPPGRSFGGGGRAECSAHTQGLQAAGKGLHIKHLPAEKGHGTQFFVLSLPLSQGLRVQMSSAPHQRQLGHQTRKGTQRMPNMRAPAAAERKARTTHPNSTEPANPSSLSWASVGWLPSSSRRGSTMVRLSSTARIRPVHMTGQRAAFWSKGQGDRYCDVCRGTWQGHSSRAPPAMQLCGCCGKKGSTCITTTEHHLSRCPRAGGQSRCTPRMTGCWRWSR